MSRQGDNKTEAVDAFMDNLDHPFKQEVQALRDCIKAADPAVTEQIKWNAPSFSYKGEYIATFNLHSKHAREHVHLVFHNPLIVDIASDLLEGDYPDGRRMAYFTSAADVQAKRAELTRIVKQLISRIDA